MLYTVRIHRWDIFLHMYEKKPQSGGTDGLSHKEVTLEGQRIVAQRVMLNNTSENWELCRDHLECKKAASYLGRLERAV